MLKYFYSSILVTVLGLALAFVWGNQVSLEQGISAFLICSILAVLEISLSFDNAVVNAIRLEHMTPVWRHRFITWGMLIAVFGMRLVFPIAIVAIFTGINVVEVTKIAFTDPNTYAEHLHHTHDTIAAFGGMFLLMLFLSFIFDEAKDIHWIGVIERRLVQMGKLEGLEVMIALGILSAIQSFLPEADKLPVVMAGISGLVLYLLVDGLSKLLESNIENEAQEGLSGKDVVQAAKQGGLISFLYLELIDASFSFDGVLGAFAISKDIVIISLGLAIGAMFVRSLTIMLVEKRTLQQYIFLEHGAHWAIGALAVIMLINTIEETPELITGLIGVVFIGASLYSSVRHNKKHPAPTIVIGSDPPPEEENT
jgi:hypothetical protein